jgi:hypothetical protein
MCMLIDPSLILPRLRVTIENLFQVSNQVAYIGCIHHSATPLTRCMVSRIHCCMDDLGQIVKELEPKKINGRGLDPGRIRGDPARVAQVMAVH